jgi:DNA-binding transcriptional ArsR family regulator
LVTTHFLSAGQLECLAMPIRLAIVQRLESDGRATAHDLAARTGRPVTSLYHHLRKLEDAGLLRIVGQRQGARRPEAIYAMVADEFSSSEAVRTPAGRGAYSKAAARVADAAARALSAAVNAGKAHFWGRERNTLIRFFMLRADSEKLAQINGLIAQLEALLRDGSEAEGEEIMFSFLMSPQQLKD